MNKERVVFVLMLIQCVAVTYWFGSCYAPTAYPAIHQRFELGNWLMGLFLGSMSVGLVIWIIMIWESLEKKK